MVLAKWLIFKNKAKIKEVSIIFILVGIFMLVPYIALYFSSGVNHPLDVSIKFIIIAFVGICFIIAGFIGLNKK